MSRDDDDPLRPLTGFLTLPEPRQQVMSRDDDDSPPPKRRRPASAAADVPESRAKRKSATILLIAGIAISAALLLCTGLGFGAWKIFGSRRAVDSTVISDPSTSAPSHSKPTVEELKLTLRGTTPQQLTARFGKPILALSERGLLIVGYQNATRNADGSVNALTLFGFDTKGELEKDSNGLVIEAMLKQDPLPDGVVTREDMRQTILGRNEDEVKRRIGIPKSTSESGLDSKYWTYDARTKDTLTGKLDYDFTVYFRDGYCNNVTFHTR